MVQSVASRLVAIPARRLYQTSSIFATQPYRAPKANAFVERWVRSLRAEVLDRLLILSEAHLRRVMKEYVDYYNRARPHQGIEQRCPLPIEHARNEGGVKCRDLLGGVIHDYYREAA